DTRFFSFFDLQLREGRFFDEHDVRKCVINETAARQMGGNVIGQKLKMLDFEIEITGVTKDIFSGSTHEPASPMYFLSKLSAPDEMEIFLFPPYQNHYFIKILPENRTRALEHIRQVMQEFHGEADGVQWLNEQLAEIYRPEVMMCRLFRILNGTRLLRSVFGIYAMVSLVTRRRRKEVALRKIAGAERMDIVRLFFREYLKLALLANLIALPVAYLCMSRWLEGYASHTAIYPWWFVWVTAATTLVISLTVAGQVWKAASCNPAEVVKSE
ncbi:MAG: ABC transporter permease, partial [Bacteroidales bacterium]|nr:ABC transporter permease [Bacteroidales bacterium]